MTVLAPGTIDVRHNNAPIAATDPPRHRDRYVQLGGDMCARGSTKWLPGDEDLADHRCLWTLTACVARLDSTSRRSFIVVRFIS